MQSSRRILLGCVAAIALLPLALRAEDTELQIKARQALEKQLNSPPPPPTAKAQPAKPAPAAAAKPAAAAPAAQPVAEASTNALENAMRQTITDLNAQPGQTNAGPWAAAAPASSDADDIAKARQAMRDKITDLNSQTEAPSNLNERDAAVFQAVQQAQERQRQADVQRKAAAGPTPPVPADLTGPVLPISAVKKQKLDTLLRAYESDQISAEQYHAERAKIMSEK